MADYREVQRIEAARICHWQGCSAGARWDILVHLECQGTTERRVLGFRSTLECCDEHRDNVKPWVLSDRNREIITTTLMEAGYAEPNFLTARIEFRPIEHSRDPLPVVEPCNRNGCTRPAKWRVIQVVPKVTDARDKIRLMTNLCVCDEHKAETKPADLLDPESRAATHSALRSRGITLRSLDRMRLEFDALTAGDKEA